MPIRNQGALFLIVPTRSFGRKFRLEISLKEGQKEGMIRLQMCGQFSQTNSALGTAKDGRDLNPENALYIAGNKLPEGGLATFGAGLPGKVAPPVKILWQIIIRPRGSLKLHLLGWLSVNLSEKSRILFGLRTDVSRVL